MFGLQADFYEKVDIHVHVPEIGAVDGPSAGVTMCTAMTSALLGIPVRRDVAMTGEITLRGRVKPIGGLKEKVMAAHRGGITTVLVPADNAKDIPEIPQRVRNDVTIITVADMDEVLRHALALEDPEGLFEGRREDRPERQLAPPSLPAGNAPS